MPRDVRNLVAGGALTRKLRADVEKRLTHPKARGALPAEAHVLGSAYSKQVDVVVASWAAGLELLISTKTMLSSYQKNLGNRFEEGYGDAKNLRGRHPLAALGFLYVVGSDIPEAGLEFAIDMLRKLVREPDVYECACLLVIEGARVEEDGSGEEDRGPEEDPALVPLPVAEDDDVVGEVEGAGPTETQARAPVRLLIEKTPDDLSPSTFFERLITAALDRMPIAVYPQVRARIAESHRA